jgi:hypothetical protein
MSADLLPLIRMVRTQAVPYPLQLEAAPVSAGILREQLTPLAREFGARLQICFARDDREALAHLLDADSVVVIASRRRWWRTREERLARWLIHRGFHVAVVYLGASVTAV